VARRRDERLNDTRRIDQRGDLDAAKRGASQNLAARSSARCKSSCGNDAGERSSTVSVARRTPARPGILFFPSQSRQRYGMRHDCVGVTHAEWVAASNRRLRCGRTAQRQQQILRDRPLRANIRRRTTFSGRRWVLARNGSVAQNFFRRRELPHPHPHPTRPAGTPAPPTPCSIVWSPVSCVRISTSAMSVIDGTASATQCNFCCAAKCAMCVWCAGRVRRQRWRVGRVGVRDAAQLTTA